MIFLFVWWNRRTMTIAAQVFLCRYEESDIIFNKDYTDCSVGNHLQVP